MRSIVTSSPRVPKETGHAVKLAFGTVGAIKAKLAEAAPRTFVIMTTSDAGDDRAGAVVQARGPRSAARHRVAVRDGRRSRHRQPGGAEADALVDESLVYVDPRKAGQRHPLRECPATARHRRRGQAEDTLVPGGYPAEARRQGRRRAGRPPDQRDHPGEGRDARGSLPKELQKTTVYAAGVTVPSTAKDVARRVRRLPRPPGLQAKTGGGWPGLQGIAGRSIASASRASRGSTSRQAVGSMLEPSTAIRSRGREYDDHGACSMKPRRPRASAQRRRGRLTPSPETTAPLARIAIAIRPKPEQKRRHAVGPM